MDEWVNVEGLEKPALGEEVIVYTKSNQVTSAYYLMERRWISNNFGEFDEREKDASPMFGFYDGNVWYEIEITHWMRMPRPPENYA